MLNKFLITAVVGCAVVVVALDASNDKLRTDYQAAALRSQSQNTVQAVRPASTQDTANPSITPPTGDSYNNPGTNTSSSNQLSTPNTGTTTLGGKQAVNRPMNPSGTTVPQLTHTLSIYTGSLYKSEVVILQNFLISKGYLSGTADGKFGIKTRRAVIEFQKSQGISQTGNVGPLTKAAVNNSLNPQGKQSVN